MTWLSLLETSSTELNWGITSSEPLVIWFDLPNTFYSFIWYAETEESVEYILSLQEVKDGELDADQLDEHWFLMVRDW